MAIRAFNKSAPRAAVIWTALPGDVEHRSPDEKARQAAADHMGLLTPSDEKQLLSPKNQGFANPRCRRGGHGGHGYITEQGMEQFVRDARIAVIVQSARTACRRWTSSATSCRATSGEHSRQLSTEVQGFIKENGGDAMKPYVAPLSVALGHLQQATVWLMQNAMGEAGQRRRRRHRLHKKRARRDQLHVVPHRQGGAGQAHSQRGERRERQARDRAFLHGAACCRKTGEVILRASLAQWSCRRSILERLAGQFGSICTSNWIDLPYSGVKAMDRTAKQGIQDRSHRGDPA